MLVAVLCNIACQFSFWCISVSLSLKWCQVSVLLQHCFQNIFGWKSNRYCNILPLTHSKSLSPQSPFCTFDTRQSAEIQDRGGVMQCDLCERFRRDHCNAPKTKTTQPYTHLRQEVSSSHLLFRLTQRHCGKWRKTLTNINTWGCLGELCIKKINYTLSFTSKNN